RTATRGSPTWCSARPCRACATSWTARCSPCRRAGGTDRGPERGVRRFAPWLVACAAGVVWLVLSPPGRNDLAGGDEGYYGTMARNVLASRAQLVSPSLSPLGPPGDKPPLYPLLIAPFVRAWGPVPAAVRALSSP